ncbi:MAG: hypothetical protein ACOYXC_07605 [Candidatus Rifleibacteriota bacterium]
MLKKTRMFQVLAVLSLGLLLAGSISAQVATYVRAIPPIPENAQYDIELADIYAELFPDENEAFVICTLWLISTFDPVILKFEGNIQHMNVSSKSQPNVSFVLEKPYIYLDNLEPGAHQVTFTYRVKHDGITSSGLISPINLRLDAASWWYPRNVAPDPHQAIVNVESPPNYAVNSNAPVYKNVANNFRQLRQFVLSNALSDGITLD